MTLETLILKEKIALTIDSTSGTDPVAIVNYSPYTKTGYRIINEYLEINNLKAVSRIYSLAVTAFPVFELEDTQSKQILAAINLEWASPRIEFDLLLQIATGGGWQRIASYSLINQSPYPYREYSLGNHLLGSNGALAIQIKNVGHGSLQTNSAGKDTLVIFGDLIREVALERIIQNSVKVSNSITNSPNLIINSNPDRKGLVFTNTSAKVIFVDTVATITTSSYTVKLDPGDYYEAPSPIYTGNYYGLIADMAIVSLDIREVI